VLVRMKTNCLHRLVSVSAGKLLQVADDSVAYYLLDREIADAADTVKPGEKITEAPAEWEAAIKKAHLGG
jgi:hypothetical protein